MNSYVVFEIRHRLTGERILFFSDYTFRYPKWKIEEGNVYFKHLDCSNPFWSSNTDDDFERGAIQADKIIKKIEKILLEE